jgi:hypothetical protein
MEDIFTGTRYINAITTYPAALRFESQVAAI